MDNANLGELFQAGMRHTKNFVFKGATVSQPA